MLRSTLLYLSNQPRVFRFVRDNRLARAFARRFVAGETLDDAIAAVRALNAKGITADQLDANVSVRLTALGLDISEDLCVRMMRDLQEDIVREGWRVRVYVPFGTQWYPYLMRRLAERPANLAFVTGNLVRETLSRRRTR